jgi:hypothetical protein
MSNKLNFICSSSPRLWKIRRFGFKIDPCEDEHFAWYNEEAQHESHQGAIVFLNPKIFKYSRRTYSYM